MTVLAHVHDEPALELDQRALELDEPALEADEVALEAAVWTATGHERPVFFDEHGRRRRWVLLGGALSGGVSAFWLGALISGAIGFSTMPSLRERSPLLASRAAGHAHVLLGRPSGSTAHRRRHPTTTHGHGSSSPLNGTTELAVSVNH